MAQAFFEGLLGIKDGNNLIGQGINVIKDTEKDTVQVVNNGIEAYNGTVNGFFGAVTNAENIVGGVLTGVQKNTFQEVSKFQANFWGTLQLITLFVGTFGAMLILLYGADILKLIDVFIKDVIGKFHFG